MASLAEGLEVSALICAALGLRAGVVDRGGWCSAPTAGPFLLDDLVSEGVPVRCLDVSVIPPGLAACVLRTTGALGQDAADDAGTGDGHQSGSRVTSIRARQWLHLP